MRIGILGSGVVGRTLGSGLVKLGHEVKIGTRDVHKPDVAEWLKSNGAKASAGSFADAARFGEILFLCTFWAGTDNAIGQAGPDNFKGKVVVDVTNPLDFSGGVPPKMAVGHTTSGGEIVQKLLPGAKVVKAFNIITASRMIDGSYGNEKLDMFIAGNDAGAKKTVTDILTAFKWNTFDLGGIEESRILEYYAMLWITVGFKTNSWNHVFKMVKM